MLSTTGFTLRASLRFHVSGPVLTLQPICRFSLASTSLFSCTCPQEPPAVGLRSNFVASGSIALDHYFLPFSRHAYPYGSTTLTAVLALQPTGLVPLATFFCFFFGIPAHRV